MTVILYVLALIISITMIYVLVNTDNSHNQRFILLMFVSIAVSNVGYLALVTSRTLESAILANKISYLGGCFLPMFMLMVIMELCDMRKSRSIVTALFIYSMIVMILVCTIGYSRIYYQEVHVVTEYGVTYLEKTYGPTHILYSILLYGYAIATLGVIIYAFHKKRNVSYRNLIHIFISEILVMSCYFLERVLHIRFELLSFAYIFFELIIIGLLRRISMYDLAGNIVNAGKHEDTTAYIVFDDKKRYTGTNALAEVFFPEIKLLKVDRHISEEEHKQLYDNFVTWLDRSDDYVKYIHQPERELKCTKRYLYNGAKNKKIGCLIEIVDDTKQQKYINLINNYNTELKKSVEEQTAHIRAMQDKMILGMADVVESRDDNTGGHIKRTSGVVRILVDELRTRDGYRDVMDDDYCEYVVKAAPMHDMGKIAVDDRVLKKPGRYEPEEYEIMKLHAAKGAEIVEKVLKDVEEDRFVEISKNIAHYHHEKWNGEGYPEGLTGEQIPLEARIMALADVFDALVSKRCYKESQSCEDAFDVIQDSLGTHFDPTIGGVFLECRERITQFYK